jgi:hypothetical protein
VATEDCEYPEAVAMALMVSAAEVLIAPVYLGELVVGVVPLMV